MNNNLKLLIDNYAADLRTNKVEYYEITLTVNPIKDILEIENKLCTTTPLNPQYPIFGCDFIADGYSKNSVRFFEVSGTTHPVEVLRNRFHNSIAAQYLDVNFKVTLYCLPVSLNIARINLRRDVLLALASMLSELEFNINLMRSNITFMCSEKLWEQKQACKPKVLNEVKDE